jgi:hypothetical protein
MEKRVISQKSCDLKARIPQRQDGGTKYVKSINIEKRFVVKITVERCDEFLIAVPQIFDMVKSVALWSAGKKRTIKGYSSAAISGVVCLQTLTDTQR